MIRFSVPCMLWLVLLTGAHAQTPTPQTFPVIEGTKLIVELIKVFNDKKDQSKLTGCKNRHADLCVVNMYAHSLIVVLTERATALQREIIILPSGRECSLHVTEGIWTYDLKSPGGAQSIRKGDILVEGCNNIEMNIK